MERVGERLRRRREELGFTIDDIARVTKYRPEIIRAVEEGRSGVFPAEAYRQAFLRAYAVKIGLDPSEIVREQKSEEERIREALKGIRVKPRRGTDRKRTVVWLVVIVAVAAALLVLYDRVIKVRGLPGRSEEPVGFSEGPVDSAGAGTAGTAAGVRPDSAGGLEAESRGIPDEDGMPDEDGEMGPAGGGHLERSGGVLNDEVTEPAAVVSPGGGDAEPEEGVGPEESGRSPAEQIDTEDEAAVAVAERGPDRLVVRVTGYAVKARLFAGDSLLVSGWLRSGFRDTFYSHAPFWADTIITQADAMLLVFNGERVNLPSVRDNVITDFRISP